MYSTRSYSQTGRDRRDTILIIGQSNAVGQGSWDNPEPSSLRVLMFANDYRMKQAYEPVDDITNQVDTISQDNASVQPIPGNLCHSPWLRAAKNVAFNQNRDIILIPSAKGTTVFQNPGTAHDDESWEVQSDPYDRGTLFGSANYRRRQVVSNQGLKAVWFMGHETSTEKSWWSQDLISTYKADFITWAANLRNYMQANVPIIAVSLGPFNHGSTVTPTAPNQTDTTNLWLNAFVARDYMRQVEATDSNMIVVSAFDLALNAADNVHLSRASQDTLGTRVGLATRQLCYGESVNGTGPRPVSFDRVTGTSFKVVFDKGVTDQSGTNWNGQFRIFDNNTYVAVTSSSLGTTTVSNDTITLNTGASVSGTASVTYGQWRRNTALTTHVVDSDGLPCPCFYLSE